jgi:hypothetical protein
MEDGSSHKPGRDDSCAQQQKKPKENAWATKNSKWRQYSPTAGSRKGNENGKPKGKDKIRPLETKQKNETAP